MTDPHPTPHRATPEQWDTIERLQGSFETYKCLLELRDTLALTRDTLAALERRVGALEAPAAAPSPGTTLHSYTIGEAKPIKDWGKGHTLAAAPSPPAGSLVEVVASAIGQIAGYANWEPEARAAIAGVAGWLERHHTGRIANGSQFADLLRETLEQEAGR